MNSTLSLDTIFNHEITRACKYLSHEEETIRITHAKNGCSISRNIIINSQMRKLAEISRKYAKRNSHCDVSELMAVGTVGYQGKNGLHNAIIEFDTTHGTRFITFATKFIENAIRDYSLDNRTIRVGRHLSKSTPRCPIKVEKYTYEAELHGLDLDSYIKYHNSNKNREPITLRSSAVIVNSTSINNPLDYNSDFTLEDIIIDDSIDMDTSIVMRELDDALKVLTKLEHDIINDHYVCDISIHEMAITRGISRQAMDVRHKKMCNKLRAWYDGVDGNKLTFT